jgi:hypothetical protein
MATGSGRRHYVPLRRRLGQPDGRRGLLWFQKFERLAASGSFRGNSESSPQRPEAFARPSLACGEVTLQTVFDVFVDTCLHCVSSFWEALPRPPVCAACHPLLQHCLLSCLSLRRLAEGGDGAGRNLELCRQCRAHPGSCEAARQRCSGDQRQIWAGRMWVPRWHGKERSAVRGSSGMGARSARWAVLWGFVACVRAVRACEPVRVCCTSKESGNGVWVRRETESR